MRFSVDKTNRTIKAILAKSVGTEWTRAPKGREVFVEEIDSSWRQPSDLGVRGHSVDVVGADGTWATPSKRTVAIYIPQLDHVQMDVARDALIAGDKATTDMLLKPLDAYAGIARAILERQVRSFAKAVHPKKSTRQIRREVNDFLRSQGRL